MLTKGLTNKTYVTILAAEVKHRELLMFLKVLISRHPKGFWPPASITVITLKLAGLLAKSEDSFVW